MQIPSKQEDSVANKSGYIGQIPVRNLWLLMFYASKLMHSNEISKSDQEPAPEDMPDMIANILANIVEARQRTQLSRNYQPTTSILNRVRGRINILKTERHQLLAKGRISCSFEQLTTNTPRNRYVRVALEQISTLVNDKDLKHRCRFLANSMKNSGVSGELPSLTEVNLHQYNRYDANDQTMMWCAKLAFDMTLPNESIGKISFISPNREERWVRELYESAIRGFYKMHLKDKGWNVYSNRLNWQIDRETNGISSILPDMKTDIVLDNLSLNRRIVIDTKFNSLLTKGWHREHTLRSGYLYQIYAYLFSQVGKGDELADRAEGVLLHPSLGNMIDETVEIQGHKIRFTTVDLSASAEEIKSQLLHLCV